MGCAVFRSVVLVSLALFAVGAAPLRCTPLPQAPLCDDARLALSRDNPERFDYYLVCLPLAAVDPSPDLQAIDPSITCGSTLHPACRGISQASCLGELDFDYPERTITDGKWEQLCRLSQLPWIIRLVGGHWLD